MTTMRAILRKDECDDKLDLLSRSGRGGIYGGYKLYYKKGRKRDPNFCANLNGDNITHRFKIIVITTRVIKVISYYGIYIAVYKNYFLTQLVNIIFVLAGMRHKQ